MLRFKPQEFAFRQLRLNTVAFTKLVGYGREHGDGLGVSWQFFIFFIRIQDFGGGRTSGFVGLSSGGSNSGGSNSGGSSGGSRTRGIVRVWWWRP